MRVPPELTNLSAVLFGFLVLTGVWFIFGSIYLASNTVRKLVDDDYMIGYFQGPGRPGKAVEAKSKTSKPAPVSASVPSFGW